ncbi:MAG: MAPEG family protein [Deltaproteobacteria bacterium]|nr:MAPEG family protein [Deltaproteobacteria bacterium]
MHVPVTTLYAGLLGLMLLGLSAFVVRARGLYKTSLGTGTDRRMEQAVRVHANFVEYVPLIVVLMLAAEASSAPTGLLHGCGATLVLARTLHAFGLARTHGRSFGRWWGTALTWTVLLVLAVTDVWLALG